MKKLILATLLFLTSYVLFSSNSTEASTTVKTAVHTYKGQPYVQISGGNAIVIKKINDTLKEHTVEVANGNKALQQNNSVAWYKTSVKTTYNNNKILSVAYTDGLNYSDDNIGTYVSIIYNFDLATGDQITLYDVVDSDQKKANLMSILSHNLQLKYNKGITIYEKSIYDIPINSSTPFYYYDNGIIVRFYPSQVAELSEGFIDIKVPFSQLNEEINRLEPLSTYLDYLQNNVTDYVDTEIEYFNGYSIRNSYQLLNGEVWKQVEPNFFSLQSYSLYPKVRIYKDKTRYYMWVEGTDDAVEVERII
ncbi:MULTISPECIES: hypothetical protein [unclassified Paenibacillus]|uniref:hypothetical protein n=1 Tax=unclassified Paenibacillus TaxID=185978 RepID=UPI0008C1301E|nr:MULTISPECIES: hypothetical protein [unclassified Paenibacillus]QLG40753.1 hypothetical protein HW560_23360 [Paenibacillus sp. E222]SEN57458.1 type I secretion C-terminal target domain (VC_A0849 subclass) [Paenibacillus sp. OK076]